MNADIFPAVGFFRVESCPTQAVLALVGLAAEKVIRDRYISVYQRSLAVPFLPGRERLRSQAVVRNPEPNNGSLGIAADGEKALKARGRQVGS